MKIIKVFTALLVSVIAIGASADTSRDSTYAVSVASYSTLVTYCNAKYGPIYGESPGGLCAERGKNILINHVDSDKAARIMRNECSDPDTWSSCALPHIFRFTITVVHIFEHFEL